MVSYLLDIDTGFQLLPFSVSMREINEECGVAAIYHLPGSEVSPLCPPQGPEEVSRLIPRMLLDLQNRGQLAAGFSTYSPSRPQLLEAHKQVGTVTEAFLLSHRPKYFALMQRFAGRAAIGHVRYATCGAEDVSYAQPLERQHFRKFKSFAFAVNGQLANVEELKALLLSDPNAHLVRETDTEIMLHYLSAAISQKEPPDLVDVCRKIAHNFDGSYNIVFLNALGEMFVARDPLGIKPLCYAQEGPLFAAASESVALFNLGFSAASIKNVEPGEVLVVSEKGVRRERFAESRRAAHCFFEWAYFANVASTLDQKSVYLARKNLGEELAKLELASGKVPIDSDTIVVPVPDTSKAAADAMAYKLGLPSHEGLIRNRYSGRTFIERGEYRRRKAETKYTPLQEVLEGKRIFLVEDSIVRSTTMRVLLKRIRELGKVREIHVRVACSPIIAPCFYGTDMSTYSELFATPFMAGGPTANWRITPEIEAAMARDIGADSLVFLPVEAISRAIGLPTGSLCESCITGCYPTPWGERLCKEARENYKAGCCQGEKCS